MFDGQAKTFTAWLGSSDSSAIFTRYCTFGIPFIWPLQNSLNGRKFNSLEYCKRHLEQFFAQKGKFWKDEIMKLLKEAIRQWNKMVNTLVIKVLGENEKNVSYFYLKTDETLQPTQCHVWSLQVSCSSSISQDRGKNVFPTASLQTGVGHPLVYEIEVLRWALGNLKLDTPREACSTLLYPSSFPFCCPELSRC